METIEVKVLEIAEMLINDYEYQADPVVQRYEPRFWVPSGTTTGRW